MSGHLVYAAIGAIAGALVALMLAPQFFWAALICGALAGGAIRVASILFRGDG